MSFTTAHRTLFRLSIVAFLGLVITFFLLNGRPLHLPGSWSPSSWGYVPSSYDWAHRAPKYPIDPSDMTPPPSGPPLQLRRIQHDFSGDPKNEKRQKEQAQRKESVRNALRKTWESYREYAWGHDELKPLSLKGSDTFSGWGATLVDTLDTLWIMGLKREFSEAVQAVGVINWDESTSSTCSVFETNIRFLGGLLSAYELSGEETLLKKAVELGHMLYAAFDTPNHLPVGTLDFYDAKNGRLVASPRTSLATVGTLSMEFTRLSQLTGDPKFFSAIDRIKLGLADSQDKTKLPGLWPTHFNLQHGFGVDSPLFTMGAAADSGYEYLPKMYALLGGLDETYGEMHKKSMETAKKHILFRPMLPDSESEPAPDILFSGNIEIKDHDVELTPDVQHLACFAGGHFALGGKLLGLEEHVKIGEQLARGCAWAYSVLPTGIMPEISRIIPCETPDLGRCEWNETTWEKLGNKRFPKGFHSMRDPRYLLRPEAVESIFLLYRMTGKKEFQDAAWDMFSAIKKSTETTFAYSAIEDVLTTESTTKTDSLEVCLTPYPDP